MSFFNKILGVFRREATDSGKTQAPADGYPAVAQAMLQMSGHTALSVGAAYRCVRLLSESVANLPLQYLRLRDGIFVEDTASRLHYLLTVQPNATANAFDFWAKTVENMLLDGNAYIIPVYSPMSAEMASLVLCSRGSVSLDEVTDIYTVSDPENGVSGVFKEHEIIHIKNTTDRCGKLGISVLTHARLTLDIAGAGDRETLNRFQNGGNVRGLVANDKSVTGLGEAQDEQLRKTAESLDSRFQKGEKIVSLPSAAEFKQISLSSTDMQFLESRKFTVREICRFFGVHPSFVFDDTSNNYKSAEMANVAFLSNTLNPILRKIECELHRKLIAPSLCCKRKFQFDRRSLYACDLDSKVKYYTNMIAAGIYTVNDWRRVENMPSVEGGDMVLVSANLRNITDTTTAVQPTAATPQDAKPETDPEKDKEDEEQGEDNKTHDADTV